jgi:hypothetical protein
LFTPHSAGYTDDLGRRVADGLMRLLEAWKGERDIPWRVV